MKKRVLVLVLLFVLMFNANFFVKANDNIINRDLSGIDEIKDNRDYLIENLKGILRDDESSAEFDFNDAIKLYMEEDLFSNDDLNHNDIENIISRVPYIWLVPVYTEKNTYWVTISKGLPIPDSRRKDLSEETIKTLESQVGKWIVPEIAVSNGRYSYIEGLKALIDKNNLTDSKVYIFGGTHGFRRILGIIEKEDKLYFVPLDKLMKSQRENNSTEDDSKVLLSFRDIKDNIEYLEDGKIGQIASIQAKAEVNYNYIAIISVSCFICVLGVVFIKRRKHQN